MPRPTASGDELQARHLRRRDDELMRRVIGTQVAVLLAVLADIALRIAT